MSGWATQFVLVFLAICVLMLGAIVVRVVRSLERTVRAVERLAQTAEEADRR